MAERGDIDQIRELLARHRKGLTIDEVSRELGINRSTASKYLNLLVSSGSATIRKLGPAKLFYLQERVPVHNLMDLVDEGIVIVNESLAIHYLNGRLASLLGVERDAYLGENATHTPLAPLFDRDTLRSIGDSIPATGITLRGSIGISGGEVAVEKRLFPVRFESGTTGFCIVCRFLKEPAEKLSTADAPEKSRRELYARFFQLDALVRRYAKNQLVRALEIGRRIAEIWDLSRMRELSREQEEILDSLLAEVGNFDEFLGDTLPEVKWHSLEDVVGEALSLVQLSHIKFFSDIRGVEVCAEKSIPRVFQALLENSAVHGRKVTSIRVAARETPEGLLVVYEDDGMGIPAEEKATLFEWGHGERRAHSLFLCRQVLDATGISIRETGEFTRGARFEILIPPGKYRVIPENPRSNLS
ncbi:MAG: helix-turn-helix domain-containing protein [Methanolinea sp.]|nr:helix-turn-helix domain-containing protein [Methanolinea sp.]